MLKLHLLEGILISFSTVLCMLVYPKMFLQHFLCKIKKKKKIVSTIRFT